MIESLTSSGVLHDLENMNPEDITIEEIAHSLSMQCRYNGHVKKFYSVAEHCVLLVEKSQEIGHGELIQKQLLLHDASEAYLGDVIRHLKKRLLEFNLLEEKISKLIFNKFNVPYIADSHLIHTMDLEICKTEMSEMMILDNAGQWKDWANDRFFTVDIKNWSPEEARVEFLNQARRLNLK